MKVGMRKRYWLIPGVLLLTLSACIYGFWGKASPSTGAEKGVAAMAGEVLTVLEPPDKTVPSLLPFLKIRLWAEKAFVFDNRTEEVLYLKGTLQDRIYPASITKLYTVHVALMYLQPEEVVTAGEELDLLQPGSSIAFIRKGHRLTVEMLIEGMLLPSGNDAAYVLAAAAGRKIAGDQALPASEAVAVFVDEMNRRAQAEGLQETRFTSPDGFHDDGHYTSMADLIRIARLALSEELIIQYTSLCREKVFFASGETITWNNTNLLLHPESPFYREEVIGLKTGRTPEAGYCLLAAARSGDREVIIAVLGCAELNQRFEDALKLLDAWEEGYKEGWF